MPSTQSTADPTALESARLHELRQYDLRETPPDPVLDDLVNLATQLCGTPVASISLVDDTRLRFKARIGADGNTIIPSGLSFSARAILMDDVFVVHDARRDAHWKNHPLVAREPFYRFFAGVPLRMASGHALGTLCVIDVRPRRLSRKRRDGLRALARQVVSHFELERTVAELRRAECALRRSEERFQRFMDNGPAVAFIKDDAGRFVYVNQRMAQRFEISTQDWLGKTDADLFGEAGARSVTGHDLKVLTEGKPLMVEEIVPTPDGRTRHWLTYKFLLRDGERKQVGGLALDITARKLAEEEREKLVCELQHALAQVKTLRGFLPICASCKNVRTDEGYWQQIESYLSEHSEVEFSHGICPACVEKIYPEFAHHLDGTPPAPRVSST